MKAPCADYVGKKVKVCNIVGACGKLALEEYKKQNKENPLGPL